MSWSAVAMFCLFIYFCTLLALQNIEGNDNWQIVYRFAFDVGGNNSCNNSVLLQCELRPPWELLQGDANSCFKDLSAALANSEAPAMHASEFSDEK